MVTKLAIYFIISLKKRLIESIMPVELTVIPSLPRASKCLSLELPYFQSTSPTKIALVFKLTAIYPR